MFEFISELQKIFVDLPPEATASSSAIISVTLLRFELAMMIQCTSLQKEQMSNCCLLFFSKLFFPPKIWQFFIQ